MENEFQNRNRVMQWGLVALIGKRISNGAGVNWEMQCVDDEENPMLGMQIH